MNSKNKTAAAQQIIYKELTREEIIQILYMQSLASNLSEDFYEKFTDEQLIKEFERTM